jgi:Protein of unknown function (DUF2795)
MDRGSSKHGPKLDEQMAHETEDLVRSRGHSTHTEEWRQTEPVDEVDELRALRPAVAGGPPLAASEEDIELRSALARAVGRHAFPAHRDALLAQAEAADAPRELIDRLGGLGQAESFANVGEVARAIGLVPPDGPW